MRFRQIPVLGPRMDFDLKRVAAFIRRAETEELLDRVTIYRAGMEPAALDLMEGELDRRGLSQQAIASHGDQRLQTAIVLPDGSVLRCNFCRRPAAVRARGWHRLLGRVPIFPRVFAYCTHHMRLPKQRLQEEGDENPEDLPHP